MSRITKHIPNTITCLNLFSGCIAAVFAFHGDLVSAAVMVYVASLFDFMDGFAARALKAYSAIGKELDSLADMVSFGFVPALVVFVMLKNSVLTPFPLSDQIPYFAFLLAVFSALRLAIFNLDERQTSSFIGLPTPANALFWVSLAAWVQSSHMEIGTGFLIVGVVVFSALMVSELPMYSLKIKNLSLRANALPFVLLLSGLVLIVSFGFLGISLAIAYYIVSSVVVKLFKR